MCLAFEQGTIIFIESAEDELCLGCHDAAEVRHVVEQNVAVDIGEDDIELGGKAAEHTGVAAERCQAVVHTIDDSVVACVVGTPLVNVIAYHTRCTYLQGTDA